MGAASLGIPTSRWRLLSGVQSRMQKPWQQIHRVLPSSWKPAAELAKCRAIIDQHWQNRFKPYALCQLLAGRG